jgi:hypothetical protein
VNVAVIQLHQFDIGFIRFFEPVSHDAAVVVDLMNKMQIVALKRAQPDMGFR